MRARPALRTVPLAVVACLLTAALASGQVPGASAPPPPSVKTGDTAPDFTASYLTAADANGRRDRKSVKLSEFKGQKNVVLAFFPAAFSGVCTKEMCTFRDSMAELNTVSAQVLGVSVDTFFALKAWADQQELNFPLLSDFNKTVIREYGVVNPDMIGLKDIAKRAVFVIDRSGTVRHREVLDDARNEPDYGKIRGALASLA